MWLLVSIICIYWIHVAVYMWLLYCLCSGMGRNHQPGHTQCPGAERPWSCQATGKHPQDKCPSLQSSGPSLCCTAGPHLFGHAQRLQGESLFRTSKFLHILHVLVIRAMFCVFIHMLFLYYSSKEPTEPWNNILLLLLQSRSSATCCLNLIGSICSACQHIFFKHWPFIYLI